MARKPTQPTMQDLLDAIEEIAPATLAESYDNVGLQVGDRSRRIRRVLVGLEVNDSLIDEAKRRRADTLVTHHPLFFLPIKSLEEGDLVGRLAMRLVSEGLALVAAHTNLDKSPEGTGPALAERLGLKDCEVLLPESQGGQFKFVVFVPEGHEGDIIEAIHEAGGGVIGDYDHCTFRSRGTGTFRGGSGTKPAIGAAGRLEEAEECRLEAVVPRRCLGAVIESVRSAHPYEEIAYDVYPLESVGGAFGLGVLGRLAKPATLRDFARLAKRRLRLKGLRIVGDPDQRVESVAVATGACEMLIRQVGPPRVDCLVTGDVKYHLAVEARAKGLAVVDPGHWASEVVFAKPLAGTLHRRLREGGWAVEVLAEENPQPDPFVFV